MQPHPRLRGRLDAEVLGGPAQGNGAPGIGGSLTVRGHDVSPPVRYEVPMGTDTAGLGGTAPGTSAEPPGGSDDRLISFPGRSPVLDGAKLGVLRGYGRERDVAADDVLSGAG
jgi:hypothetical protein